MVCGWELSGDEVVPKNWHGKIDGLWDDHTSPVLSSWRLRMNVKAMHHWIRKGEDNKAYASAREVFKVLLKYGF